MIADNLSRTLSAIADPTRRAILARLAKGTATVNELAYPFDLSLPTVSKHLKVLENAELILRGRDAQYRPCTLHPAPLREAADWLDGFRALWDANFRGLDTLLETLTLTSNKKRNDR